MNMNGDIRPPRWFLMITLSLATFAGLAWAGWVTKTCLDVSSLPGQIAEINKNVQLITSFLISHGK